MTARLHATCDAIVVARGPVHALASTMTDGGVEAARQVLTAMAALSRPVDAGGAPERWRYRRGGARARARAELTDVSLIVVRQEVLGAHLAIVTHASWRAR